MKKQIVKPSSLYLSVSITGAAVLIIEVTATRLLSPYFGMTLFTVSSILAVILAALSTGYWLGGKLADQLPRKETFFGVILTAGLTTLLIHFLNKIFLPIWALNFDLIVGPLITSFILFFIPTLFLGMISPIAIRVSTTQLSEVGNKAGRVFFFGTAGSIVGSLLAGFILIPHFPISKIILGTSLTLVVLGSLGLFKKIIKKWIGFIPIVFVIYLVSFSLSLPTSKSIIFEEDSMYQHIRVLNYEFEDGKGLLLMLDRTYAGAGYLDSNDLPFRYTRYYKLYELVNEKANKFLYLGGGAYTTPRKLLTEREDEIEVDVVEIDPKLPKIASQYFHLPQDPRLKLIIDDARNYLAKTSKKYDMIFIDVFSMDIGIPPHLMTQEFFKLTKNHLHNKGTVVMNVAANIDNRTPSLGISALKTFRSVFPQSEFIALNPSELASIQNILFWGVNDASWRFNANDPKILDAEAEEIRTLVQNRIDLSKIYMKSHKILTDDYAPVEYLVVKMIISAFQQDSEY